MNDYQGNSPLHQAAYSGKLDVADFLIKNGLSLEVTNKYGWTPLHRASYNGKLSMVKFLLLTGSDTNAVTYKTWKNFPAGSKALDLAITNKQKEVEIYLSDLQTND